MEEPSVGSGATTYPSEEVSHSDSNNHQIPFKNLKHSGASASKFKGVVSQQNGHWGAQIYANHQRIWLGTFKSEKEAALAYDSAAIKLCNGDARRNFPWTDITGHEPNFQSQFSTDLVLSMIKDGSYTSKFSDYLRARVQGGYSLATLHSSTGIKVRQLFQKELTPSDVSKLNRLVIPKKYAVKFFPHFSEMEQQNGGISTDDVELVFFDRSMRSWKFRYCYWKSSQSFVFTRGWNRFAKEKGLRPKDRVIFSTFKCSDGLNEVRKLCMIDVAYNDGERGGRIYEDSNIETALQLKIGQPNFGRHHGKENDRMDLQAEVDIAYEEVMENHVPKIAEKKGFKLFGVQIIMD